MFASAKQVIGKPLIIDGRELLLSRAVRPGDFVFLTGQVPIQDGVPMTNGTIEEQTRACLDAITETLMLADCQLEDIVKSMVWLKSREGFPKKKDNRWLS